MIRFKIFLFSFIALAFCSTNLQAQCFTPTSSIQEDFTGVPYEQRPTCWNGIFQHDPGFTYNFVYNGEYWMFHHHTSPNPIAYTMITALPKCTVKGPLTFDMRKMNNFAGTTNDIEVGTMSDPNDHNTFVPFQTVSHISTTVVSKTVDFTNYAGTNQYIAFRCILLPNNGFVIDNVSWTGPPPPPLTPQKIQAVKSVGQ